MCVAIFLGSFMNRQDFEAPSHSRLRTANGSSLLSTWSFSSKVLSPGKRSQDCCSRRLFAAWMSGVCRSVAAIAMKIALFRGQFGYQSV